MTIEELVHNYYKRFKHELMLKKKHDALRVGGESVLNLKIRMKYTYLIFCSFIKAVLNKQLFEQQKKKS